MMVDKTVLPAWWLSWYTLTPLSTFELHSPWWVSGERERDGAVAVVAAVRAIDEDAAWGMIRLAYDDPNEAHIQKRFIDRLHQPTPFSSRFPQGVWMDWDAEGNTCRCEAVHADRQANGASVFPGYGRSPQHTERLVELLGEALRANPNQRLGQLLVNLSRGADIWDVRDEHWIRSLETTLSQPKEATHVQ